SKLSLILSLTNSISKSCR
ncbi:hypothetical protein D046_0291B, partial [Vibrio parahaemolyticus V-223/04]